MKVRIVGTHIIFSFTLCILFIITYYIKTNASKNLKELTFFKIIINSLRTTVCTVKRRVADV